MRSLPLLFIGLLSAGFPVPRLWAQEHVAKDVLESVTQFVALYESGADAFDRQILKMEIAERLLVQPPEVYEQTLRAIDAQAERHPYAVYDLSLHLQREWVNRYTDQIEEHLHQQAQSQLTETIWGEAFGYSAFILLSMRVSPQNAPKAFALFRHGLPAAGVTLGASWVHLGKKPGEAIPPAPAQFLYLNEVPEATQIRDYLSQDAALVMSSFVAAEVIDVALRRGYKSLAQRLQPPRLSATQCRSKLRLLAGTPPKEIKTTRLRRIGQRAGSAGVKVSRLVAIQLAFFQVFRALDDEVSAGYAAIEDAAYRSDAEKALASFDQRFRKASAAERVTLLEQFFAKVKATAEYRWNDLHRAEALLGYLPEEDRPRLARDIWSKKNKFLFQPGASVFERHFSEVASQYARVEPSFQQFVEEAATGVATKQEFATAVAAQLTGLIDGLSAAEKKHPAMMYLRALHTLTRTLSQFDREDAEQGDKRGDERGQEFLWGILHRVMLGADRYGTRMKVYRHSPQGNDHE